jgi:hypothetical protein
MQEAAISSVAPFVNVDRDSTSIQAAADIILNAHKEGKISAADFEKMQEIFSCASQFKKTNTEGVINAALGNLDKIANLEGLSQQVGSGLHQESIPTSDNKSGRSLSFIICVLTLSNYALLAGLHSLCRDQNL